MASLVWYNHNCAREQAEKVDGVAVNNEQYPGGTKNCKENGVCDEGKIIFFFTI